MNINQVRKLHSGDEITIRIGNDSHTIIICEIEEISNRIFSIVDMSGEKYECDAEEIS